MLFSSLDLTLIVLYFLAVVLLAYWHTRKSSHNDFLIADRKLGVITALSSINATKTGSIILIFTALLYSYGSSALWYFIGLAAGYLLFIPFAVFLHKKHGGQHYTLAEYFSATYGTFSGKCVSILNILIMSAWLILNLMASSKVLAFTTSLSFEAAAIVVAVFVIFYLVLGGFRAVVITDVLQYGAILVILCIFTVFLLQDTALLSFDWNLDKAGGSTIAGFFLVGVLLPFSAPDLWQRVYAVESPVVLRKSILWSVVVHLCFALLLTLIGLSIKAKFPFADSDTALIYGFSELLPSGLSGLAIVVFFAAFMSSIDTYAYTASASLVHDFWGDGTQANLVKKIRVTIIAVVLLSTLTGIAIQDLLLGGYMFVGFAVLVAIPVIATWIKPSISKVTLNIALFTGPCVLITIVIYKIVSETLTPLIILISIVISISTLLLGALWSRLVHGKLSAIGQE